MEWWNNGNKLPVIARYEAISELISVGIVLVIARHEAISMLTCVEYHTCYLQVWSNFCVSPGRHGSFHDARPQEQYFVVKLSHGVVRDMQCTEWFLNKESG